MRKRRKSNPVAVKRVPGVHLTEEDVKDIQKAARRLLNKMESENGGNLYEDISTTHGLKTREFETGEPAKNS